MTSKLLNWGFQFMFDRKKLSFVDFISLEKVLTDKSHLSSIEQEFPVFWEFLTLTYTIKLWELRLL